MQIRRSDIFTTIRTEGAILPADLLQRIAEGDRRLEGLTPEDYHLAGNEKLNEAANRSWNRLLGAWLAFKDAAQKLRPDDPGTSVTRERWLLILFQELGYGRLQAARAVEIDGKSYPISHFWQHVPIHLVGLGTPLDRRTAGVAGAARTSPHSLVQEYLNRSDASLWGMVSNGLKLRILRDNVSLTRQAYVEFDLEAMMNGEVYSDFALLWLLCHQSRFEGEEPESCRLEQWSRFAQDQGTRALDQLRDGVAQAIEALGRGFLHKSNSALRDTLRTGALDKQDYYRELLRLVYRLLFLFVAEDRDLLCHPDAGMLARERYVRFYSTARLRRLAEKRRGSRHTDLFEALRVVMTKLGADEGCPELGLPTLGSFLFSAQAISNLESSIISNEDFLDAIRALAVTSEGKVIRLVDYKNLGSEELGSVYESLLELHPELNLDSGTFSLSTAGGHERKTTGSYYTPTSLITCLLDSALDPVLEETCKKTDPERALLGLKVCDPACGSGHFLIAAAHRIARRLAAIRTGDEEPAPESVRTALRDVIGHCIYGVDVNEMAVELCKVALWMEALEPGKPLSFLDHRIRCGNSLLGTTPALLEKGIPDVAFQPIEGDDKSFSSALKKLNKVERNQMSLPLAAEDELAYGSLADHVAYLDSLDDESISGVHEKEESYTRLNTSEDYRRAKLLADAWCAAFVWKKRKDAPQAVTQDVFRRLQKARPEVAASTISEIERLATQYNFFHWHMAFPDVFHIPPEGQSPENPQSGWDGGFHAVLGNPPWERLNLEARQFFAATRADIGQASTDQRRKLIDQLKTEDSALYARYFDAQRSAGAELTFYQNSGRYPHLNQARLNTYILFVESSCIVNSRHGRTGLIVPSGVATDDTARNLFHFLISERRLVSLFDFENRERIFPAIDGRYRFCLLTLTGSNSKNLPSLVYLAHQVEDLSNPAKRWTIDSEELKLLNPITGLSPTFQTKRDRDLVVGIHRRVPPFILQQKQGTAWAGSDFLIMFRSDSSSHLYRTAADLCIPTLHPIQAAYPEHEGVKYFPVWEAKLLSHFDHRLSTYAGVSEKDRNNGKPVEVEGHLKHFVSVALPRTYVPHAEVENILKARGYSKRWLIGYRDVTNSTNERTAIASFLPLGGACQPLNLFLPTTPEDGVMWLACFNSLLMDYVVRQSISGLHLNITTCRQLPILDARSMTIVPPEFVISRVAELVVTSPVLSCLAEDLGYGAICFQWDDDRRFLIRCELDAAFFHLYGINREDTDYIMDTFPIVKRKDEAKFGEYRTKRVILDIYDALSTAIRTGQPYATRLDPPPGPPAGDLPDWPPGTPQPANWPPHIHPPQHVR